MRERQHWPVFAPAMRSRERYDLLCKLALTAERMKQFGVRVDVPRAAEHARLRNAAAERFKGLFLRGTGLPEDSLGAAGAGQTAAVKDWFKERGAPEVVFDKRTKKSQFNSAALTIYATDYPGAEFAAPAAALLGLRKARTAVKFCEAYMAIAPRYDNRIHFGFNVLGTKGERWSSSMSASWEEDGERVRYRLNAQNVPAKKLRFAFEGEGELDLMVPLRDVFIPDRGCVWAKFDYDGAEARLIAYNTADEALLSWIAKGLDLHVENAKAIFRELKMPQMLRKVDKAAAQGTVEYAYIKAREAAKPMMYGASYQWSSHNPKRPDKYNDLFKQIKQIFPNTSETYLGVLVTRFFEAHPGIVAWHDRVGKAVEEDGYVELPQTGRQLYLPASNRGKNMGLNFYMQSGLGAAINRAIPLIDAGMDWKPGSTALLLMVHDEVDVQIPEARVEEVCAMVESHLSAPMDFGGTMASIPAEGDIGPNWGVTAARTDRK